MHSSRTAARFAAFKPAYVVLTFLAHSYTVGLAGRDVPLDILPAALAIPWFKVSRRIGVKPVVSYSAVGLWNWTLIDDMLPVSLEYIQV